MQEIYIAGPFFSKAQIKRLAKVENALRINPTVDDFYSPRKFQKTNYPKNSLNWGKEIYDHDMARLITANSVVAIVDHGPNQTEMDSGTAYEIGAADIMNKPIIIIHTTKDKVNLMIAAAPNHANLTDINNLKAFNFRDFKVNDFKGKMF